MAKKNNTTKIVLIVLAIGAGLWLLLKAAFGSTASTAASSTAAAGSGAGTTAGIAAGLTAFANSLFSGNSLSSSINNNSYLNSLTDGSGDIDGLLAGDPDESSGDSMSLVSEFDQIV